MSKFIEPHQSPAELAQAIVDEIGVGLKEARVGARKALTDKNGSEALLSTFVRWKRDIASPGRGSRISRGQLQTIVRTLTEMQVLSPQGAARIWASFEIYEPLAEIDDGRKSPLSLGRSSTGLSQSLERLERFGMPEHSLGVSEELIGAVSRITTPLVEKAQYKAAAANCWEILRVLEDPKLKLRSSGSYRNGAIAHVAWQMAWFALQIEHVGYIAAALRSLSALSLEDPAVEATLHTVRSYKERVTHESHRYPNVSHAQMALRAVRRHHSKRSGLSPFKAIVEDPLVSYNAANELRLLGRPMFYKFEVLGNNTIETHMRAAEESSQSIEQKARIQSSIVRGLVYDRRRRYYINDKGAIDRVGNSLNNYVREHTSESSSLANAKHALGLVLALDGNSVEAERNLIQADKIYKSLGATNRRLDVSSDLQMILRKEL